MSLTISFTRFRDATSSCARFFAAGLCSGSILGIALLASTDFQKRAQEMGGPALHARICAAIEVLEGGLTFGLVIAVLAAAWGFITVLVWGPKTAIDLLLLGDLRRQLEVFGEPRMRFQDVEDLLLLLRFEQVERHDRDEMVTAFGPCESRSRAENDQQNRQT